MTPEMRKTLIKTLDDLKANQHSWSDVSSNETLEIYLIRILTALLYEPETNDGNDITA